MRSAAAVATVSDAGVCIYSLNTGFDRIGVRWRIGDGSFLLGKDVGHVVCSGCREKRLRGHIFPSVAKKGDEILPFFVLNVRIFESCEKELVS